MTEPAGFALWVSGLATLLALLAGLPLAWLLGRHQFRGKSPLQALLMLPVVLPASLLGYCLVLLGQRAEVARVLSFLGLQPAFTWQMAVLIAWVGALAIFVRAAQAEFARVDRRLEQAARTLGRSEWSLFWSVTLPLAWRGVVAGIGLAFGRAIGEIALTLLVARVTPTPTPASTLGLFAVLCAAVLILTTSRLTRAVS